MSNHTSQLTPAKAPHETEPRTLIDAAADHIHRVVHLHNQYGPTGDDRDIVRVYAVPPGHHTEQIDFEHLLTNPRRARGKAEHHSAESLVDYIVQHESVASTLWIKLDPATNALTFRAVLDDHNRDMPGWRGHTAEYTPRLSLEWTTWAANSGKPMGQADFAAWMEDRLPEIAQTEGLPSGADMLTMLLDFEAKQDMRVKASVRLQSGGSQLEYINTDDAATIARMRVFDRFALAIPVFWGRPRYPVAARLRYRIAEGKVRFWYELIRPDRVHEEAAKAEIATIIDLLAKRESTARVYMGNMGSM